MTAPCSCSTGFPPPPTTGLGSGRCSRRVIASSRSTCPDSASPPSPRTTATYRLQLRRILGQNEALSDHDLEDQFALIRYRDGHLRLPAIIGYYAERTRFRRRWIGALERLDVPALILWGRRDPVAVPAIAEALAAQTPGARLVWMEDLGHYPQLEDPQRVVTELWSFLGSG